jgi:hypothetical protein
LQVLQLTTELTDAFFDAAQVIKKIDDGERRRLGRIGAYIRNAAKWSLRRRKKSSEAGSPPSVHSRDSYANLRNILYAYQASSHSVIVGPVGIGRKVQGLTVPEIHEFGAIVRLKQYQRKDQNPKASMDRNSRLHDERGRFTQMGQWFSVSESSREVPWMRYRMHNARYRKRPFMRPALMKPKVQAMILDQWRASVSA